MIFLIFIITTFACIAVLFAPLPSRHTRCRAMSPIDSRRCHLRQDHLVKHEARWKDRGCNSLVAWEDPLDAHLAAPVRNGREVRDPPDDHRVPIAEVVRWAERRAIAEVCPLDGDPHQASVAANPPATEEVVSLIGGGVSRVQTEITASSMPVPTRGSAYQAVPAFSGPPMSGGGGWIPPAAGWIDVTAVGDSGRVYIPGERRDGFSSAAEAAADLLRRRDERGNQ